MLPLCEMDDAVVSSMEVFPWARVLCVVQHSSFRTGHLIDACEAGWLVRVWLPLRLQWRSLTVVGTSWMLACQMVSRLIFLSSPYSPSLFFPFSSTCQRCAVEDFIFWTPVTWSTFIHSSIWLSNLSHQEDIFYSRRRWWSWLNEAVCDPFSYH